MERRLNKARNYLSLPRKSSMNGQCRHASIRLLDGESLEVTILPRITVDELHAVVADHSGLDPDDRKYFGLAWIDESTKQFHWLSPDKKLLDSEIPSTARTTGKIVLYHNVKFFVDDFCALSQVSTVQLYFLDTQQQLAREQLDLSISDHIQLASLLIHIFNGDAHDESQSLELLRIVIPLPRRLAKDSILTQIEWETKVLAEYDKLKGLPRGTAIVRFMAVAQLSSTYGSRFYRVIDQSNCPCVLALNSKGIVQFDKNDLSAPVRVFEWRSIDNIYYKECHFSVEVRNSRSLVRDQDSKGEETEKNSRSRSIPTHHIFTFIVDSSFSCRSLWSSSISQHQFFLDQSNLQENNRSSPSLLHSSDIDQSELCERLNRLVSKSSLAPSIHSLSSLHASSSTSKMPLAEVAEDLEDEMNGPEQENVREVVDRVWRAKTAEERSADLVKYKRYIQLKKDLTKALQEKMMELRHICIAEGELTGVLPIEFRSTLRPGEEEPKLKRRIGTSFSLSEDLLRGATKADRVDELETEVAINRKIVAAADRLAKDKNTNKSVRKKRQKDLAQAQSKLKGLETNLNAMRLSASKPDVSLREHDGHDLHQWSSSSIRSKAGGPLTSKSCPTTPRGSMPDLTGTVSEGEEEEGEGVSRPASCSLGRDGHASSMKMPSTISVSSGSAAPSGTSSSSLTSNSSMGTGRSVRRRVEERDDPLRVLPPSYDGYRSSASYKSSYRTVHYPTLQEQESMKRSDDEVDGRRFVNVKTGWEPAYQQSSPLRVLPSRPSPYQQDLPFYPTGSLDRRMNKRLSPSRNSSMEGIRHPLPSRDSSPSTQRITTFPVSSNAPLVFRKPISSQQSVPLLPSVSSSFHLQGPSLSSLSRLPPSSFSSSRLPSQSDPHMEALIDFYRDRQSKPSKTATIV
ncbi:hypothetical protein PFISCL1PPCAC_14648 [Pristionchus fissidentatus]|uniref:FERM domain-containing protein n=1 Tax=Pristionchus fissidentatus TaxID=1538716 RepID=A0AAV5VV21_9BILA|nr:hypothetical protein PFISCL1PPCAC_14648 [Pristionchus fissidentatus]